MSASQFPQSGDYSITAAHRASMSHSWDSQARSAIPADREPAAAIPGAAWFALHTRSRAEFSVERQLAEGDNVATYVPTSTVVTRWTDREKTTTRPLFPGYVFAKFHPSAAAAVLQTRGVIHILSIDREPVPISEDVIDALRKVLSAPRTVEPCPYVAGDTVTVARGPFAGVSGIVSRIKGATMLSIPVEIMGRSVSVEIDATDVESNAKNAPAV